MEDAGLPAPIRHDVEEILREGGRPDPIRAFAPLGGGCIHPAGRVETRLGRTAFLKWSPDPGWRGFPVEARGLRALAERGGLRTPRVLGVSPPAAPLPWLLLEHVESGRGGASTAEALGEGLARLHRPLPDADPGWEEDGWIGSLPQGNCTPGNQAAPGWSAFWRDARLSPQWERAAPRLDRPTRRGWELLMERVEPVLDGAASDGISLLHGDLWSGNILTSLDGEPVLVDPAVYRGHREVDLAMLELFGGIDPATLRRYREEAPLLPGYPEVRRDLYQLYPLLVHVNLFGQGYASRVAARVARLVAALAGG